MFLAGYVGAITLVTASVLVYLLVPLEEINASIRFGLFAGLGIALGLIAVMQNVLDMWRFYQVDWFTFWSIPLFLSMTWLPLMIIFKHLLGRTKTLVWRLVVITMFPLLSVFGHWWLITNHMLVYHNWNLPATFLLAWAIHGFVFLYLYIRHDYKYNA